LYNEIKNLQNERDKILNLLPKKQIYRDNEYDKLKDENNRLKDI
jgi:hypothetical protein